jgi:exonuclease SbcD
MRILHTADWHLGRTLEGHSRQEEHERMVDELCAIARDEDAHLVLIAGDIFDSYNPPAAAEELYCEALARLGERGRRAVVVIAGNHDSPERLCAVRALARRHGAVILGYPLEDPGPYLPEAGRVRCPAAGPGWVEVALEGCSHSAVIAAVPYPSEARLNQVLTEALAGDELQDSYSRRIGSLFQGLKGHSQPETVRLAVSHLFVAGGEESESEERPIQMGGAYAVRPSHLPTDVHYIALGHLHKPQQIRAAPVLCRYAGAPLAYSFSETGQAKSVVVLEVEPNSSLQARLVPLSAARPLVRWYAAGGLSEVQRWIAEGRDATAWLEIHVAVPAPLTMDQIQALKRARERIVAIRPVLPEAEVAAGEESRGMSLAEQFQLFYRQRTGGANPPEDLVRLFLELVQDEAGEGLEE